MRKKERESISMKDAVGVFLKAQGLDNEYREKEILGKWEELVGKPISMRTEELTIKNKVLHIKLNSAVMRDELFQRKGQIIDIMNKAAGFEIITEVFLK
jgi:predicted nucleic acid-binding Zn ribbon protein